jgi:hypothetical protein
MVGLGLSVGQLVFAGAACDADDAMSILPLASREAFDDAGTMQHLPVLERGEEPSDEPFEEQIYHYGFVNVRHLRPQPVVKKTRRKVAARPKQPPWTMRELEIGRRRIQEEPRAKWTERRNTYFCRETGCDRTRRAVQQKLKECEVAGWTDRGRVIALNHMYN